eukprot:1506365-Amphidinium_carterae.1
MEAAALLVFVASRVFVIDNMLNGSSTNDRSVAASRLPGATIASGSTRVGSSNFCKLQALCIYSASCGHSILDKLLSETSIIHAIKFVK